MTSTIGLPYFTFGLMALCVGCSVVVPGQYREMALWLFGAFALSAITRMFLPPGILPMLCSFFLLACAFKAVEIDDLFIVLCLAIAALFYWPIYIWPDWDYRYAAPHVVIFILCLCALFFTFIGGRAQLVEGRDDDRASTYSRVASIVRLATAAKSLAGFTGPSGKD